MLSAHVVTVHDEQGITARAVFTHGRARSFACTSTAGRRRAGRGAHDSALFSLMAQRLEYFLQ